MHAVLPFQVAYRCLPSQITFLKQYNVNRYLNNKEQNKNLYLPSKIMSGGKAIALADTQAIAVKQERPLPDMTRCVLTPVSPTTLPPLGSIQNADSSKFQIHSGRSERLRSATTFSRMS